MKVRQVELVSEKTHTVVWVNADLKLTPGVDITGGDGRLWKVTQVYACTLELDQINHKWEVGGLA